MAFRVASPFSCSAGDFAAGHVVQAADLGLAAVDALIAAGFLVDVGGPAPQAPAATPADTMAAAVDELEASLAALPKRSKKST